MSKTILFAIVILLGCSSRSEIIQDKEPSIAENLIGEWRNIKLKVTMNSVNGIQDSVMILEADSTNWENIVQMKPIQTFFEKNGTYHSDHYAVNGSLLFSAKGTWAVSNDTLIMKQTSPNVATYRLKTEIINDVVTFSGKLDFDEDGAEDDDYYGIQRKQNSPH